VSMCDQNQRVSRIDLRVIGGFAAE